MPTRKYQHTWERLKVVKNIAINLDNVHLLSDSQIAKQFSTLRRAISKEKHQDYRYKDKYPHALITSDTTINTGEIIFHLDPDKYDVINQF